MPIYSGNELRIEYVTEDNLNVFFVGV